MSEPAADPTTLERRQRTLFVLSALAVTSVAVALRLLGRESWSFWLDEGIQLDFLRRGFGEMWGAIVSDAVHPPLDYVAGWLWYRISTDETWLRVLPLTWSVGTLVAVLIRSGGRTAPVRALAAASAFATFPLAVFLGQELRPYASGLCFAAAFDAARFRSRKTGGRWPLAASVVFGVLACWTLYWAGLYAAFCWGLDLFRAARRRDRGELRRTALGIVLTLLLALPWLILVARQDRPPQPSSAPKPTLRLVLRFAGGLMADRQDDVKQPLVAATIWAVVLAGVAAAPRGERLGTLLELSVFSGGVLVALSLAGHFWALRYLALALLPASRAIGQAAERLGALLRSRPAAALGTTVLLLFLHRSAIADGARWARPDWRRPADYLGFMGASGAGGSVVAADPWAYFCLKAQLGRARPAVEVELRPGAAELDAWIRGTNRGWIVRAPGFGAPEELDRRLSLQPPWARFEVADGCRLYRVEAGRVIGP